MKCKCIQCGRKTKNIPKTHMDRNPAKGWYWTSVGLMCNKCYNKLTESLVSNHENSTLKDGYNGVWS